MVTLYLSEVWLNSQWTNSWLDTYTYDASGDELTYLNQQWQNGQWTNMFLDTLTSSASGDELTYLVEECRTANGRMLHSTHTPLMRVEMNFHIQGSYGWTVNGRMGHSPRTPMIQAEINLHFISTMAERSMDEYLLRHIDL